MAPFKVSLASKTMLSLSISFIVCSVLLGQTLQSPQEYFTHRYGHDFIPYHLKVDYFKYLADQSNSAEMRDYGSTVELRPLIQVLVSSPENLARSEEIRLNNLKRAGQLEGEADADPVCIVMLSYSVHGDEAAGSEAALLTLYELLREDNDEIQQWLENTLVIMNLCLNPDGHARYVDQYARRSNTITNLSSSTWEHLQPWPGGRTNHYYFDLNRDWSWQTQKESKARLDMYHDWMPHIHADLHEMGINSPYYFAPAAKPYHEYITEFQRDFQQEIGKNHAGYFDQRGWLYFTKEVFDLLYPAYGDTYPLYNGAIGMTYEQGGSGRAGSAVTMENGDTLTLSDRIEHHTLTSLSTIEVASKEAERIVNEFSKYFEESAANPSGEYVTYVIPATNNPARMAALVELLDRNRIEYGHGRVRSSLQGYDYVRGQSSPFGIEADDLIISAYQPKSTLVQVLFDPNTAIEDSVTYDITAWSLPYLFGLNAFATTERIAVDRPFAAKSDHQALQEDAYATIIPWDHTSSAKALARLHQQGIKVRTLSKPVTLEGASFERGSLVVTRADNEDMDMRSLIQDLSAEGTHKVWQTNTGWANMGPDLGSGDVQLLKKPKVLLITGESTSPGAFGSTWYYFEEVLKYPVSIVPGANFSESLLNSANVLVMPSGGYRDLQDQDIDLISDWVGDGGKLIVTGGALRKFAGKNGFRIQRIQGEDDDDDKEGDKRYADRERRMISERVPGALIKNMVDVTHPLGYGLDESLYSLKTSHHLYELHEDIWNVVKTEDNPIAIGFVGAKLYKDLSGTMTYGVQQKGRGVVVYMVDDPLFRGFWDMGHLIFANALFQVW